MTRDLRDAHRSMLRCPRDGSQLRGEGDEIRCDNGHSYPIVDGVPILLVPEMKETIGIARASAEAAAHPEWGPLYLDTVGLRPAQKEEIAREWDPDARIDAVIAYLVGATSGHGYAHLVGNVQEYPVPDIPLPVGDGRLLLDIGSSWGRWSVSAARKGWRVVAIDPSLGALLAAKRAFGREGLDMFFVCGDARHLPFADGTFQTGFSYSVMQHFSEEDAETAVAELGRVLQPGGIAKVQMAQRGLRYQLRKPRGNSGIFRVRYWPLKAIRDVFSRHVGKTEVHAEAVGGLGLLREDYRTVSPAAKALIVASAGLKGVSRLIPPLIRLADSVYVTAVKP